MDWGSGSLVVVRIAKAGPVDHIFLLRKNVGFIFGKYPVITENISESDRRLVEVAVAQHLGIDDCTAFYNQGVAE